MNYNLQFLKLTQLVFEKTLSNGEILEIGRKSKDNFYEGVGIISGNHAKIEVKNNRLFLTDVGSTNGTFVNNERLEPNKTIEIFPKDKIYFANPENGMLVLGNSHEGTQIEAAQNDSETHIISNEPKKSEVKEEKIVTSLNGKKIIRIGRSKDSDIVLEDRTVSRNHATLHQLDDSTFLLTDQGSTNGTYYNGKRINKVKIDANDTFIIGKYIFNTKGEYSRLDKRTVVKLENVSKVYGERTVIHPLSIEIKPKSLTAIMGPSGCGKSTVLKMINGIVTNSTGKVALFDLDLKKHYDYFKSQIGYVPQDDVVHLELTVYQSIFYAAKLRLQNYTDEAIDSKINFLLDKLKIAHIKNNLNSEISGGQRKRVCIAIELLSDPMLLLLDEPTSPLDPQSIEEFLNILKDLTNSGTTIIMVTHKPDDLLYMDEVIFLSDRGHMTYRGGTDKYLDFFKAKSATEVYSMISGENAKKWDKVNQSSQSKTTINAEEPTQKTKVNWLRQLYWLTVRNIRVKTNDVVNSLITVLQAPIIGFLIGFVFNDFSIGVVFMIIVSSIWFGVNNASREIVKEKAIFGREKLFNLYSSTYLLSKVITLFLIALMQTAMFVGILYVMYQNSDSGDEIGVVFNNPSRAFLWLLLINMASAAMGLLISTAMKTSDKVLALVPIILIPQLMLAGVITKITNGVVEFLSYFTFSRWGAEGAAIIQQNVIVDSFDIQMVEDSTNVDATLPTPEIVDSTLNMMPPAMPTPELVPIKKIENAIDLLNENYYESYHDTFGELSNRLVLDFGVVVGMGFVLLLITYLLLRKKKG